MACKKRSLLCCNCQYKASSTGGRKEGKKGGRGGYEVGVDALGAERGTLGMPGGILGGCQEDADADADANASA